MKTAKECLEEWHTSIGDPMEVMPAFPVRQLRRRLIDEEASESKQAIIRTQQHPEYRAHIWKELSDLAIVTYGTAWVYGLDLDAGIDLVHESNMTKLIGGVNRRYNQPWNKVEKGPHYREPEMKRWLARYDKERESY